MFGDTRREGVKREDGKTIDLAGSACTTKKAENCISVPATGVQTVGWVLAGDEMG